MRLVGKHVGIEIHLDSIPARVTAMRVAIIEAGNVDVVGGAVLVDGLRALKFLQVNVRADAPMWPCR